MSRIKKILVITILLGLSIPLIASTLSDKRANISENYQAYLLTETFPSQYMELQRDYFYRLNVTSNFYRTSQYNEEEEFALMSRTEHSYANDGKLQTISNYYQHQDGQLIIYSMYHYYYDEDLLMTIALESYEEFEILTNTTYYNYYYDENNLIDYITRAMDNQEVFEIDDYTHNSDGLLTRIDFVDNNNQYIADNYSDYYIYEYDDNSKLYSRKSYKVNSNHQPILFSQSSYTYNDNGNLATATNGDVTSDYYTVNYYFYDDNCFLTRIERDEVEDYMSFLVNYVEITNDENGNNIRQENFRTSYPFDYGYFCTDYTVSSYLTFVDNNDIDIIKENNLNNYPNPFNPQTTISFNLKTLKKPSLTIYNLKGQLVKSFNADNFIIGENKVVWDGKDNKGNDVVSGLYLYKLKTDSFTKTNKMVLIK